MSERPVWGHQDWGQPVWDTNGQPENEEAAYIEDMELYAQTLEARLREAGDWNNDPRTVGLQTNLLTARAETEALKAKAALADEAREAYWVDAAWCTRYDALAASEEARHGVN